jgi:hypothetical protein
LGRGAKGAERRLRVEIRGGLDIGNFLLLSSVFTEGVEIPENVRVECAIQWPFRVIVQLVLWPSLIGKKNEFLPLDQVRAVGARGWPIDSPERCLREFWKVQC